MVTRSPRGLVVLAAGVVAMTLSVVAQTPQTPPSGAPGAQGALPPGAPGAAAQGPGGGRGAPMWEADFSKTGTVPVLSPPMKRRSCGSRLASSSSPS